MHQQLTKPILITVCCLLTFISSANAKDTGFLGLSIGYYNALDNDNNSAALSIEYRSNASVVFKNLKPWLGVQITNNFSIWSGGGLFLEFEPKKNTFITTLFGVGVYSHGDKDIDLSHPIQFRSQIEIGYKFQNKNRISLALNHMSHAGLGGNSNPGSESILLYFNTPINSIF